MYRRVFLSISLFSRADRIEMFTGFHYNIDLPEDLDSIIEQDFWMLEGIGPQVLNSMSEPLKFASTTWIVMYSGHCKADINLISYEFEGPTLITIQSNQIMQPKSLSPDFKASFVVMSKRFWDNLFIFFNNTPLSNLLSIHPVVPIPEKTMEEMPGFFKALSEILADSENPYGSQALLYTVVGFAYKSLYKCFEPYKEGAISKPGSVADRFLTLVQKYFRTERFLEFYAEKLDISSKHLSRSVKLQTGYSATEWIERFVILEAKVLLKSSNLNIQQIASELKFPSQSFFGKYFKKCTGMTPREFRNASGKS